MRKGLKIALILIGIIILLAAILGIVALVARNNQRTVQQAVIEDFDLTAVPDGTYTGKYNAFPVIAEVKVTVKDHTIVTIDLVKHINGEGGDAEVLPGRVVQAQSLLVDTVSGATYSSKVILLAIQNALENAAGGKPAGT